MILSEEQKALLSTLRGFPAAALDVGKTIARGAAMQPVAGYRGIYEVMKGLRGGEGWDASVARGVAGIRDIEEGTRRDLETKGGERALQSISDFIEPFAEAGTKYIVDPLGSIPGVGPTLAAGTLGAAAVLDPSKVGGKVVKAAKAAKGARAATPQGFDSLNDILTSQQAPGVTVRAQHPPQFPGIYGDPKASALEAERLLAPESPNVTKVFGPEASREALAATNLQRGPGIEDPKLIVPGWVNAPKGSEAAQRIMTPENTQRMVDIFGNLQQHAPRTWESGLAWYMGDPKYKRLVQLVGEDEAKRLYNQHINFSGVESPELSPPFELRRGSNAMFYAEQGGLPDFAGRYMEHGGKPPMSRARRDFLPEMENVPGRKGQMNAAYPQYQYLLTGDAGTQGPKVKPYILSHGVPETGFQNILPVADAHFARSIGLPDVRNMRFDKEKGLYTPDARSIYTPELQTLAPWYADVTRQVGLKPGQGQPVQWVGMAHHTGVKPPYGASKLEMIADRIMQQALKHGEPMEKVRDEYLLGKRHLGNIDQTLAAALAAGGAATTAAAPYLVDKLRERREGQ